jgi:hypothetical protein
VQRWREGERGERKKSRKKDGCRCGKDTAMEEGRDETETRKIRWGYELR